MLFRYVDRVVVMVHTTAAPDVASWHQYCAAILHFRSEARGVLVFTQGGGPNSKQREEMRLALGDRPSPPVAIMTSSPIVRSIITSLNWFFGQSVAAFAQDDLTGPLRHLSSAGHTPSGELLLRTLSALAGELGVQLPATTRPPTAAPGN
jgi:hypothetical protein